MKNVLAPCLMIAAATCGVLASPAPASAAPRAPMSAVEAEIAQGRALREKGDLEGARRRFESAWEAGTTATAGYELATVLRAQGRLNEAYDVLFQVAELRPVAVGEVAAQNDAARLFAEVDAAIPMVLLDLDALGGEVVEVSIDGQPLPRAEWGEAQPLDPGQHEIVVLLRDGSGLQKAIAVKEGARARVRFAPLEKERPAPILAPTPPTSCPQGAVVRGMQCVRLRNYGWQLGVADGITSGLFVLGVATYPDPTYDEYGDEVRDEAPPAAMLLGMVTYPLASPVVHWSHGHVGRGFASLGIHTAAWFGAIATIIELDGGPRASGAAIATLGWNALGFGLDYLLVPHKDEIPVAADTDSTVSLRSFGVTPIRGGAAAAMQLTF